MVQRKRKQTYRDKKGGPTMATAVETSIVVQRNGYTQWQSGKPTSLAVRRFVALMLLSGPSPLAVYRGLPAVRAPSVASVARGRSPLSVRSGFRERHARTQPLVLAGRGSPDPSSTRSMSTSKFCPESYRSRAAGLVGRDALSGPRAADADSVTAQNWCQASIKSPCLTPSVIQFVDSSLYTVETS